MAVEKLVKFGGISDVAILVNRVQGIEVSTRSCVVCFMGLLRVAHAPGMLATFSPPLTSKETDIQRSQHASRHVRDARAVVHVGIANLQLRGKRSRHSRHKRKPQFYVSGKRPMK